MDEGMKAMEAPEKIYCESDGLGNIVKVHNVRWPDDESENIEYTRTDAFIEKVCEWLEPVFRNYSGYNRGMDLVEDFRKYMEL